MLPFFSFPYNLDFPSTLQPCWPITAARELFPLLTGDCDTEKTTTIRKFVQYVIVIKYI